MASWVYNRHNPYSLDNLINNYVKPWASNWLMDYSGYNQMKNTQKSINTQIDYERYLRSGFERQLRDWNKNVGSQGRTIRYPELSYYGKIRGTDTAITRLGLDYNNSYSNFTGNILNKSVGLYGVPGRVYRSM